jgi:hypothetical protein
MDWSNANSRVEYDYIKYAEARERATKREELMLKYMQHKPNNHLSNQTTDPKNALEITPNNEGELKKAKQGWYAEQLNEQMKERDRDKYNFSYVGSPRVERAKMIIEAKNTLDHQLDIANRNMKTIDEASRMKSVFTQAGESILNAA